MVMREVSSGHSLLDVEGPNHCISLYLCFPISGIWINSFTTQF